MADPSSTTTTTTTTTTNQQTAAIPSTSNNNNNNNNNNQTNDPPLSSNPPPPPPPSSMPTYNRRNMARPSIFANPLATAIGNNTSAGGNNRMPTGGGYGGGGGSSRHRVSLLRLLHLSEDNARFLLLGVILVLYAISGAGLFMFLEAETEAAEMERRLDKVRRFRLKYPRVARADLEDLLEFKMFIHNYNNYNSNMGIGSTVAAAGSAAASSRNSAAAAAQPFNQLQQVTVYQRQLTGGRYNGSSASSNYYHYYHNQYRRWTFTGALYFVYTLMTTTGFGMTTPRTKLGRAITVVFGFFGCTCTILFFNLFLERVITLLTLVITTLHRWAECSLIRRHLRRRSSSASDEGNNNNVPNLGLLGLVASNPQEVARRLQQQQQQQQQQSETSSRSNNKTQWKPSLYAVFFVLFFMSTCAIFVCSVTFVMMEETWSFVDSVYASFVAFATIGFGDFVPAFGSGSISASRPNTQASSSSSSSSSSPSSSTTLPHTSSDVYRIVTIMALAFGTCCYYSLFNVSSILVKRFLTLVISKLDVDVTPLYEKCCRRHRGYPLKPVLDSKNRLDAEVGGGGGGLDECELKRRKSVIAHLRAAAVDRAMARYNSRTGTTNNNEQESQRLFSVTSTGGLTAAGKEASDHGAGGHTTTETSFSTTSTIASGKSSSNNNPFQRGRPSNSSLMRGRPKPQVMHPSVVDSDDEDDDYGGKHEITIDHDDGDDTLSGGSSRDNSLHTNVMSPIKQQQMIVRSEALKKVGMMKNNAIVLALMQKQLHAEQARRQQQADEVKDVAFGGPVGPLAIAKNMLEQ